jgi:hypothetical protein
LGSHDYQEGTSVADTSERYGDKLFTQRQDNERDRLTALAEALDTDTRRRLGALPLRPD